MQLSPQIGFDGWSMSCGYSGWSRNVALGLDAGPTGDKVKFVADKVDGAYVITAIEPSRQRSR